MRFTQKTIIAAATLASVTSAAAHEHHQHARFHQHAERDVETVVVNDVAIKYVFDGQEVPYAAVCQGLANGTFEWDPAVPDKPDCSVNAPAAPEPVSTSTVAKHKPSAAAFFQKASSVVSSVVSSATEAAPSSSAAAPSAPASIPILGNFLNLLASNPGVDRDFPDGQLPCEFSSLQDYGAVPLDYLGYGGYTTLVSATVSNLKISGLSGNLASGGDGDYFSYACPMGYMKTQWPEQSDSQTVGGVTCRGGKFHLTNPSQTKLCTRGAGSVNVQNKLGKVVSVCGTDYPGNEAETVPAQINPGGSGSLAITMSGSYFKAAGHTTSAQYYLNPSGYDITKACQWGSNDGTGIGNWAPVILGLGTDPNGEMVYVGLLSAEQVLHDPASPGKPIPLNYDVTVSGPGQTCKYVNENGKGNFYMNGQSFGYLGQTFAGSPVPGATCGFPVGSDITVTFS